jgi:hypothetical protein
MKTQHETIRDQRRPIRSAMGAAPSAPKNVPAERIETISEVCEASTFKCPVESRKPVENSFCQYLGDVRKDEVKAIA